MSASLVRKGLELLADDDFKEQGVTVEDIIQTVAWKTPSTFSATYLCDVPEMLTSMQGQYYRISLTHGRGGRSQTFKKRRKGPTSMNKEHLMTKISTNKQGVKKQLRQLKRREGTKNKPTVMGRSMKSAIDVYYSKQTVDLTELNVQCLLQADKSSTSINTNTYEKIIEHNRGRMAKDRPIVKKTDDDTAFTDKDFELFAEEYKTS